MGKTILCLSLKTASFCVFIQVFLFCISVMNSFNVDTSNPKKFIGPFGSYFGYSVALLENHDGKWVLVGAPKANDSSLTVGGIPTTEPGMLLKCSHTGTTSCDTKDKITVYTGNVKRSCRIDGEDVFSLSDVRRSWLGVSLDVMSGMSHSVVVCAHRWKNQEFNMMNGLCYEIPNDLSSERSTCLPALVNSSMQLTSSGNDSFYNYGMATMGISATYSQGDLLLGAPGMMDYTGGVVKIFTKNGEPYSIAIQRPRNVMRSGDLVGYSVSTGRYFTDKEMYYAAGGPRVKDVGEVYIFSDQSESLQNSDVRVVLKGEQLGGYFGGVLCTADVNHDGIDDLLVGAPLHSSEQEEGAVYVYLGPLMNGEAKVIHGSNTPKARFGSAISNLGDLNADSYDDIVVGAPFEMEGVIYIYNGFRDGLWHQFTQRIMGQEIDSRLKAFGSSFSRPLDMDNNKFADFAVGAYNSDMAVLLYTRSLLAVDMTMTLNPKYVDPREEMTLKLCFNYMGGNNLPDAINMNVSLEVDALRIDKADPRRAFIWEGGKLESLVAKTFRLPINYPTCDNYTVVFRLTPEKKKGDLLYIPDLVTPIIFESRYDVSVEESCRICSMLKTFDGKNPENPWEAVIRKTANFMTDCGVDNVCESALQLSSSFHYDNSQDYMIISITTQFKIYISVNNIGEDAYATQVILHFNSIVTPNHVSNNVICYSSKNNTVTCNIGNPLKSNDRKEFVLFLKASDLSIEKEHFDMFGKVVTTSTDKSPTESKQMQISVKLKLDNNIDFISKAMPSLLVTSDTVETVATNQSQWMYFSHVFDFQNLGPSPMPSSFLYIFLSHVRKNDEDLLYVDNYKISPDLQDAVEPHSDNSLGDSYVPAYSDGVFTDCASQSCKTLTYHINDLLPVDTVSINITYKARADILKVLQQNTGKLSVSTVCEVKIPDLPHLLSKNHVHNQQVTTDIYPPKLPAESVKTWVIVISILGGLALVALAVLILYKLGFFKRKKRDELLKMTKQRGRFMEKNEMPEHQADFCAQNSLEESNMIPKECEEI